MAEQNIKPSIEIPGFLQRDSVVDLARGSKMLGLSVVHTRRLIKSGKVPVPFRIGYRKLGWHAGTLADFVAAKAAQQKAA